MTLRISASSDRSTLLDVGFDSAPVGLVVCDEDGRILRVNRRIVTGLGYSEAELIGRAIESLIPALARDPHDDQRPRAWPAPARLRPLHAPWPYANRRGSTGLPVDVQIAHARSAGRRVIVISIADASERLELMRALQAESEERIRFERLVADLTARFANIPIEQVDETITDSLHRIVEGLDIDRGVVWQFTEDGSDMVFTHAWIRPGFEPAPAHVSTRESFPWGLEQARAGRSVWNATMDEVPSEVDRENLRRFQTRSNAVIPLILDGRPAGALSVAALRAERAWDHRIRDRLQLLATVFAQALARRRSHQRLLAMLEENERLRERLERENLQLRRRDQTIPRRRALAAESAAVRDVLAQLESVAPTDATVLLLGETGSGKEVVAEALHDLSRRRDRPMVRVNCAAIPAALLESELFGRERGAYTGALSRQIGRFELAHGATLFLDEIGELSLESQVKLLRVTQDHVIERLGGNRSIQVDVRLIAATNRDLARAVAERTFREDLFHRINVFPIRVPPLRERLEDLPGLVWMFVEEFAHAGGRRIDSIAPESLDALRRYRWPGNVRELRNVVERAVILSAGSRLVIEPPSEPADARVTDTTLAGVEGDHIRRVLEDTGWRVRGPGGASERLGIKPTTLESRMERLGIRRPGR